MRQFTIFTAGLIAAAFLFSFGDLGAAKSHVDHTSAFGAKTVILWMDDGTFSDPIRNPAVQQLGEQAFLVQTHDAPEQTSGPSEVWLPVSRMRTAIVFDSLDVAKTYHANLHKRPGDADSAAGRGN